MRIYMVYFWEPYEPERLIGIYGSLAVAEAAIDKEIENAPVWNRGKRSNYFVRKESVIMPPEGIIYK